MKLVNNDSTGHDTRKRQIKTNLNSTLYSMFQREQNQNGTRQHLN